MQYLEGSTSIQKILIILFVATIVLSCVSLVGIMIEKPDKVSKHCEHTGGLRNLNQTDYNFSDITDTGLITVPNCTTTVNPPMSSGLVLLINLSTVCAGFFIAAAIIAYIMRKNKEPEEESDENENPPVQ